jgi:hypothetical protein
MWRFRWTSLFKPIAKLLLTLCRRPLQDLRSKKDVGHGLQTSVQIIAEIKYGLSSTYTTAFLKSFCRETRLVTNQTCSTYKTHMSSVWYQLQESTNYAPWFLWYTHWTLQVWRKDCRLSLACPVRRIRQSRKAEAGGGARAQISDVAVWAARF